MGDVVAIIVTYNRIDKLRTCIKHISNQTIKPDILVVDNASSDGTDEWLLEMNINAVRLPENTGGAGGFNHGIKEAIDRGYKHIWLMDDDCYPKEDALEQLLSVDKKLNGEYGFLSSTVLWTDGKKCEMNIPKAIKGKTKNLEGLIPVEQATFVSMFMPSDTPRTYGLPIKDFFIWGDDIEYTRRIAVRGKKPCYLADKSQVVHDMENNNGSKLYLAGEDMLERYRFAYRNEAYLYRKEGIKGCFYYLAKCGYNIIRCLFMAKSVRFKRCGIIISSMFRGLSFNPEVERV